MMNVRSLSNINAASLLNAKTSTKFFAAPNMPIQGSIINRKDLGYRLANYIFSDINGYNGATIRKFFSEVVMTTAIVKRFANARGALTIVLVNANKDYYIKLAENYVDEFGKCYIDPVINDYDQPEMDNSIDWFIQDLKSIVIQIPIEEGGKETVTFIKLNHDWENKMQIRSLCEALLPMCKCITDMPAKFGYDYNSRISSIRERFYAYILYFYFCRELIEMDEEHDAIKEVVENMDKLYYPENVDSDPDHDWFNIVQKIIDYSYDLMKNAIKRGNSYDLMIDTIEKGCHDMELFDKVNYKMEHLIDFGIYIDFNLRGGM